MKLAIFGGKPAFDQPQYVGAPYVEPEVRREFHQLIDEAFDRNYLTNNGPLVQRLEAAVARLHGVRHCVMVNNATIAQIILLKALALEGEVILPSFTFIATAHACKWENLKVVFADISPRTLMLDSERIEALITPATKAVIGVHIFGNVCDVPALTEICQKHRLTLIFDAAHAFGCTLGDTSVGNFGVAEFLSFHATKFFGTFEGGAILTNDADLDKQVRYLINFGFQGYDQVVNLGLNGKMSEASAAMGLASLSRINQRIENLRRVKQGYQDALGGVPGIRLLPIGENGKSNFHYAVLLVDEAQFGLSRDELNKVLWEENIKSRRYFFPGCHQMEYYQGQQCRCGQLDVTEQVCRQVLCLPTNFGNPGGDTGKIGDVFSRIHAQAREVRRWCIDH